MLIVAVGFLLRTAAIVAMDTKPGGDSAAYQLMALKLVAGEQIADGHGNRAFYNIGYPYFVLAPVFAISNGSVLVAQIANALLGVVSICLCFAIAREADAGRTARLSAAVLWAIYLPAVTLVTSLLKENLLTPVMLGVIWCAIRYLRRDSLGVAALCGALIGIIALTGNAGLVLVPVAVFAICAARTTSQRKASALLVATALSMAIPAPWMIRNARVLGSPVLNTNGGFNLYLGNNSAANGYFVSISETPRAASWESLRLKGEVEASSTLRREAISWIWESPGRFMRLALRKGVYFWTPPWHNGNGPGSTAETLVRRMWFLQFVVLVAAAVASLFTKIGRNALFLLWLSLAGYTAVHMIFYVNYRYRRTIIPLVCILASVTFEKIVHRVWHYFSECRSRVR